jgi:HK97 family phage portal protein
MKNRFLKWLLKTMGVDPGPSPSAWVGSSWGVTNYNQLSREGYEHCATVYKCINVIATAMATVLLDIRAEKEDGKFEAVPMHPLIQRMHKPNPLMGRAMFLRNWANSLLLGGRAYIWANVLANNEIAELWPLPAGEVEVVWSATYGIVSEFVWTPSMGGIKRIPPEQVLYTWLPNPRDLLQPMSPLKAAAREVDIENDSLLWNLSLLRNGGKPPYWIGLDKDAAETIGTLRQEHVDDIKLSLREEYSGPQNVGKVPIFRVPGLKLEQYGWTPQDMDWLSGLEKADVRIANVYNVPPELIGAQKKYENYTAAQRALYTDAVLPLVELLADNMSNWKMSGLFENERVFVRRESIKELQEDRATISARVSGEVDRGIITRNEARAELGYPAVNDPLANVLTVDRTVTPLSFTTENAGTEEV